MADCINAAVHHVEPSAVEAAIDRVRAEACVDELSPSNAVLTRGQVGDQAVHATSIAFTRAYRG
jgi:hypothetical protein